MVAERSIVNIRFTLLLLYQFWHKLRVRYCILVQKIYYLLTHLLIKCFRLFFCWFFILNFLFYNGLFIKFLISNWRLFFEIACILILTLLFYFFSRASLWFLFDKGICIYSFLNCTIYFLHFSFKNIFLNLAQTLNVQSQKNSSNLNIFELIAFTRAKTSEIVIFKVWIVRLGDLTKNFSWFLIFFFAYLGELKQAQLDICPGRLKRVFLWVDLKCW